MSPQLKKMRRGFGQDFKALLLALRTPATNILLISRLCQKGINPERIELSRLFGSNRVSPALHGDNLLFNRPDNPVKLLKKSGNGYP